MPDNEHAAEAARIASRTKLVSERARKRLESEIAAALESASKREAPPKCPYCEGEGVMCIGCGDIPSRHNQGVCDASTNLPCESCAGSGLVDPRDVEIERLRAQFAFLGTITPCQNCDGSGKNAHGDCCRIPGHSQECACLLCKWKNAFYIQERELIAVKAQVQEHAERSRKNHVAALGFQERAMRAEAQVESLTKERDEWRENFLHAHKQNVELEAAGRERDSLKQERDALLGNPDAVHLGAQAAITALWQAQEIVRERDSLAKALRRCMEVACATGSHRAAEIMMICAEALKDATYDAEAKQ